MFMLGILQQESSGFEGNLSGKKMTWLPSLIRALNISIKEAVADVQGILPFDVSSSISAETMIIKLTYYKAALILAWFVIVRVGREG